ncbi:MULTISPECIES: beta strand repeat-containing protein [unclassified Rhizobium]|uniref:beta strand repeat-containing protein n=1 Tax=unclassified Rhizobium TaxID=2613769 RepID=UPI0007124701|nr:MULTISPECIES: calcium-binding protein [unclassified Rhizobium]KQS95138.1 hypothetical protein ASG50_25895 [Rhizobium sp. Leaf386]KQS95672.1 hypothetical protein ASG42_29630 [Rhizobium sp. Leaf391]KQU01899.1 hypothetical protein ASG68_28975 [Rhizobium sp. Leaf453]
MSDIVVLAGKAKGYRFEAVDGRLTVVDIDATDGNTGTTSLTDAKTVRFDDGDVDLGADTVSRVGEVKISSASNRASLVLDDGSYYLSWLTSVSNSNTDIHIQRYDAAGTATGDEVGVTIAARASVIIDPSGSFVVVGNEFDSDGVVNRTFVQRYDAMGGIVSGEVDLVDASKVYTLSDGGFVTTSARSDGLYVRLYDTNFAPINTETKLDSPLDAEAFRAIAVTQLEDGTYVVSWATFRVRNYGTEDQYSQRYDHLQVFSADGTALSGGKYMPYTPEQGVAALQDGGFVVTSVDEDDSAYPGDIVLRHFDADGVPVGGQIAVSITTEFSQRSPSVAVLSDGSYVVVWLSQRTAFGKDDILARHFDSDGNAIGGEIRINTTKGDANFVAGERSIIALADGGYIVKWTMEDSPGIFTQRVDANDNLAAFDISGTAGNDTLNGGAGVRIDGLAGDDILNGVFMVGGDGNDTYFVNNVVDRVIEKSGGASGVDTVRAGIDYVLSDNVENLILTGSGYLKGTGNDLDNTITGNNSPSNKLTGNGGNDVLNGGSGNDTLIGGSGNDTLNGGLSGDQMEGGTGNDTYYVDGYSDRITEVSNRASGGIDTIISTISLNLHSLVENLTLAGTANESGMGNSLDNIIIGNSGNNGLSGAAGKDTLVGGAGNDSLNGGTGIDRMEGGTGNDYYFVDQTTDVVIESSASNGGIDTIISSVARSLGAYQENLTLTDSLAINGNGNSLDNTLIGNANANTLRGFDGNDVLDGGAGADTLDGGIGNDVFILANGFDTIIDSGGNDVIRSTISRTLVDYSFIERLTLQGTDNINGTGNAFKNTITGNDGDNTLDGGGSQDTLAGGLGNDRYMLAAGNDTVSDSGGIDTIYSTISRSLMSYAEIERLTLQGGANINGTGNLLNNSLAGNTGNNTLIGAAGNDIISGGAGNDILIGGTGNDTLTGGSGKDAFVLNAPPSASTNVDQIADFSVADDTIRLENAIFTKIGAAGALSSSAFVRNSTGHATTSSQRLIYESDTGELYYDSNGSASGGSVLIAVMDPNLAMTYKDFIII